MEDFEAIQNLRRSPGVQNRDIHKAAVQTPLHVAVGWLLVVCQVKGFSKRGKGEQTVLRLACLWLDCPRLSSQALHDAVLKDAQLVPLTDSRLVYRGTKQKVYR